MLRARATPARLAMLAVILVSVVWFSFWLPRRRAPAPAFADPPSAASASSTFVDNLDVSGAANDADRARFRDAARALRRGEVVAARRLVDEIVARDPGFASAQLFRAYLSFLLAEELDEPGRAALRAASNPATRSPNATPSSSPRSRRRSSIRRGGARPPSASRPS